MAVGGCLALAFVAAPAQENSEMIPAKVILQAKDGFQPGLAVALTFGMAQKNSFHYIAFLGADGKAEVSREELLRSFDEDRKLFIMDYAEPRAEFAGDISGHILIKREIQGAIEAYEKFGRGYQYPTGHLENLRKALVANVLCDPHCTISLVQVPFSGNDATATRQDSSKPVNQGARGVPFSYQAAKASWIGLSSFYSCLPSPLR